LEALTRGGIWRRDAAVRSLRERFPPRDRARERADRAFLAPVLMIGSVQDHVVFRENHLIMLPPVSLFVV
jgi:hypothetical protein